MAHLLGYARVSTGDQHSDLQVGGGLEFQLGQFKKMGTGIGTVAGTEYDVHVSFQRGDPGTERIGDFVALAAALVEPVKQQEDPAARKPLADLLGDQAPLGLVQCFQPELDHPIVGQHEAPSTNLLGKLAEVNQERERGSLITRPRTGDLGERKRLATTRQAAQQAAAEPLHRDQQIDRTAAAAATRLAGRLPTDPQPVCEITNLQWRQIKPHGGQG
jgi:hypothetical protein